MSQLVKLLPHQARFVQAPYVFADTRFFFLIGGYACGKTSSLVFATMKLVKELLGKHDKEYHNPKILIGSKNITFLSKTFTNALVQNLQNTNSQFSYDKARNIITIGNVELILIGLEDPSTIYGYSCFEGNTLIATARGDVPIKDVKADDYVLTTKGFKRVKRAWCNGVKDCIKVTVDNTDIICTPDHKFIDYFDNEIEAKDLTKITSLVKLNTKRWQKWLNTNGEIEQSLKLLTSMVFATTDTQIQNHTEKSGTTLVQTKTRRKVSQLCIEICGLLNMERYQKVLTYTTKMATLSTTLLRILNLLQEQNTQKSIGDYNQRRNENRLLQQLKRLKKDTKNFLKTQNTGKNFLKEQKKQWRSSHIVANALSAERLLQHTINVVLTVLLSAREQQLTNNEEIEIKPCLTEWKKFVRYAAESLKLANMHWLQLAHLTAKTSSAVGQYTVYDLEIEDVHEFFANGLRVHNCAAGIIDELDELPTNVAIEAVKSVNDRIRQQIEGFREPFLAFATTSQGLKGLYQTVLHFRKNGIGYVLMRARTQDNTFLPKDYVNNMYSIYNEKERKCLLEGEFISIDSGLVYPDYDPVVNKLDVDLYDSIEENDTVYVGNDFNSFGNAGVACVVKKDCIVVIKDYTFPDVRRIPEILRYDFPTQKIVWIPDATATAIYSQYKKELRAHDIKIAYRKSNPLVQDRTFAINKLLHAQKLFVCPICKEVEHTFLTHQKDVKTGMPMKGGQGAPDHHGDALSYAVYHILCWCREMKELYNVTLGRKKLARLGSIGQEVDADYRLLNPDKIAFELPENVKGETKA